MLYFKYLHLGGPRQTMQHQLIWLDCQFGLVFQILQCLLLQEHQSAVLSAHSAPGYDAISLLQSSALKWCAFFLVYFNAK